MELLFVWINQYKGIRELPLNFSNEYLFSYEKKNKKITINAKPSFIPKFFGDNITNLTAIVGENGTGKTSALRYIIEYLSDGSYNHSDDETVVFVKSGKQIQYYSTVELKIESNIDVGKINRIPDTDKIRSSAITIFASNTFDPTSYYSEDYLKGQLGETKNISTMYLLYSDYQNRTGEDAFRKNLTYEDRFSSFSSQEFIRMVRLLRWLNSKEDKGRPFPVAVPPLLNLKLYFNKNENFNNQLSELTEEAMRYFNELSEATSIYFNMPRSSKNRFMLQAFLSSIYHFINEIKFISGPEFISEAYKTVPSKILEYIKNNEYENHPQNSIVPEMHDIFYYILQNDNSQVLNEPISKIQSFLQKLDDFVQKRDVKISKDYRLFSVELTKANKTALEDLIEEYFKTDRISGFAEFFFSHSPGMESTLSSGEYAMLILFARLNSLKLEYKKPLIILMDEAELALHPQWQKEFIYHFTDFISERFSSHNVQIIITAHSPFILSDMPSNCVILLKKENGKSIVVDGFANRTSTFGANIHELFTESFFLKDGLMGEFARKKIAGLIEELNDKVEISKEEFENSYKKRIEIIGEPFLQAKLFELVAKKSNNDVIDSIIEQRSIEIEILKKMKKK